MTGFYVCLNRGNVDPKVQQVFYRLIYVLLFFCKSLHFLHFLLNGSLFWQRATEAAGRSLVSVIVDHIFLCIKDAGKLLMLLLFSG